MHKSIFKIHYIIMITLALLAVYSFLPNTANTTLSYNHIKSDSTKIFHATTLELKCKAIPDSVFLMTHLVDLAITGMDCDYRKIDENGDEITTCWTISEIPSKIKNLQHLENLKLKLNTIQTIPIELAELKKLHVLDLTDNSTLTNIDNLSKLESLEELYLFGCNISKLPSDIGKLKKLKQLGLSNNNIEQSEKNRIIKALPKCEIIF